MKERCGAIARTVEFVEGHLENGLWTVGQRLPPIRELAVMAAVSPSTAWKATAILKKRQLLTVRKGGRSRAGAPAEIASLKSQNLPRLIWQKKRAHIEQDIRTGVFSFGERLPSTGQLQVRYGVCSATMRKILNSLVDDGVIELRNKSFLVPRVQVRKGQSTIVLIVEQTRIEEIKSGNIMVHRVIDSMEAQCLHHNVALKLCRIDTTDPKNLAKIRSVVSDDAMVLGYVVYAWETDIPDIHLRFLDIIHDLANRRKPITIFDETGSFGLPLPLSERIDIRMYRIAGRAAGRAAARKILGAGHTRVAFMSWCSSQLWSKNRFQGIHEEFEKAGVGTGLVPLGLDKIQGAWELPLGLFKLTAEQFRGVVKRYLPREYADDYVRRFRHVQSLDMFRDAAPEAIARARAGLRLIESLPSLKIDAGYYRDIFSGVIRAAENRALDPYVEPLLTRMYADRSFTAIIAAEDRMAVAALQFLASKGVRVPQDVSIIGFDNSISSLQFGITSYDFNMPSVAYQMLSFILFPQRGRPRKASEPIEVDGVIIERDSIARAQG